MFKHDVENSEELAHGGGERKLGRFAGRAQTAIEGGDDRVAASGGQSRHVQRSAHRSASAPRLKPADVRGKFLAQQLGGVGEPVALGGEHLDQVAAPRDQRLELTFLLAAVSYTHLTLPTICSV